MNSSNTQRSVEGSSFPASPGPIFSSVRSGIKCLDVPTDSEDPNASCMGARLSKYNRDNHKAVGYMWSRNSGAVKTISKFGDLTTRQFSGVTDSGAMVVATQRDTAPRINITPDYLIPHRRTFSLQDRNAPTKPDPQLRRLRQEDSPVPSISNHREVRREIVPSVNLAKLANSSLQTMVNSKKQDSNISAKFIRKTFDTNSSSKAIISPAEPYLSPILNSMSSSRKSISPTRREKLLENHILKSCNGNLDARHIFEERARLSDVPGIEECIRLAIIRQEKKYN